MGKNLQYLPADSFDRENNTYSITGIAKSNSVLGLDYDYNNGDNTVKIYLDSGRAVTSKSQYKGNTAERHLDVVKEGCDVEDKIRIEFKDSEAADGFHRLILSW